MELRLFTLLFLLFALQSNGQKVNSYEYWFDNNFTGLVKTNISSPSINYNLNLPINTSLLEPGIHMFNIRFKDDSLRYSVVKSSLFYKLNNKITYLEYWFDENYNSKISQTTKLIQSYLFNTSIYAGSLTSGMHRISFRFKDSSGLWSSAISSYFYKGAHNISAYEYWTDDNYSTKTLKTFSPPSSILLLDTSLNLTANSGIHTINLRFKDDVSNWSSVLSKYYYKGAHLITDYEYWIDNDISNKKSQTVSPQGKTVALNLNESIIGTTSGLHQINIHFKDDVGNWSPAISKYFYQSIKDGDRDGLSDSTETAKYGTDTSNFDTNNDILGDGPDVFVGFSPLSTDTDLDGIINTKEAAAGTNPLLSDTDFDGINDKADPFPLDRFRSKLPLKKPNDHVAPTITLIEPL